MEASENHKASLDELQKLFDQLDRAELSAALKEHGTLEAATHVLMETHFPSASPDSSPKVRYDCMKNKKEYVIIIRFVEE